MGANQELSMELAQPASLCPVYTPALFILPSEMEQVVQLLKCLPGMQDIVLGSILCTAENRSGVTSVLPAL